MNDSYKRITRRNFLRQSAAFSVAAACLPVINGCESPQMSSAAGRFKKPNVLMIVSDDQGCGDLGYNNNPRILTPNLDKLAAESTRLTNYIVSPLCAPTRASLMTGRYNYRTGVWDTWMGRLGIHEDELTLAEAFRQNGYTTGLYGKWHLGENIPMRPQDKGFDDVVLWTDPIGSRFDPVLDHNGRRYQAQGFLTDILFDHAIAFIENNADRPFFAYVPSYLPHDNNDPQIPPEYVVPYSDMENLTQGDKEVYAMMTKLDENVGRILSKLRAKGLEKNTIVIYFSDNGPLKLCPDLVSRPEILACEKHDMGDRYNCHLRGGKTNVYDGGIKTPCFIRWPGRIPSDRDVDTMTAHIDMMPTLLGLCGLTYQGGLPMDGMDFSKMLMGKAQAVPDRAVIIQSDRVEVPQMWINSCVRQQRWKLVNGSELYDLQIDPGEKYDVAAQHPNKVNELREIYENWYKNITDANPFVPGSTILGSPRQPEIRFSIWHRHSTGWPLKVITAGKYHVRVVGIQQQLFGPDSVMAVRFGQDVYKKKIAGAGDALDYGLIELPEGKYNFDIWPEGSKKPEKMYYGNEDYGYREVVVNAVQGKK